MAPYRSLDKYKLIAHMLHDVAIRHGAVFNHRSLRNTLSWVMRRLTLEGDGFLTKTLPSFAKALDKALAGGTPLSASKLRFKSLPGSELPRFLGEFTSCVLRKDGTLLPDPCAESVKVIRQICTVFYKYELPYSTEQEQAVIARFEENEQDLSRVDYELALLSNHVKTAVGSRVAYTAPDPIAVVRGAVRLLDELFQHIDLTDIRPKHGPGAVATGQRNWDKYRWRNVSSRITNVFPLDAFFCASSGHVCDSYTSFGKLGEADLPARVLLVPKDSRGPRLISCEPVDYQWVQQGVREAIYTLVERHPLTRGNVRFTDQEPNQHAAMYGSYSGRYATLDLKDASDRVSLRLVQLLFPQHVTNVLEACRSSATVLPDGRILNLRKFAPMGSALCFPIMALTIWAILTAAAPDADTRESIYVYGDDVIVPTAYASCAIEQLEFFGLKVNREKSCTSGLFRESCGTDAFKGVNVTPVKLKTVWSSSPSPDSYVSWLAYANEFYRRGYFLTYEYIVGLLADLYQPLATADLGLPGSMHVPEVPQHSRKPKKRWNADLQRLEYRILTVVSPSVTKEIEGWSMLLRWFTEVPDLPPAQAEQWKLLLSGVAKPFSVRSYTRRGTSKLVRRWRSVTDVVPPEEEMAIASAMSNRNWQS